MFEHDTDHEMLHDLEVDAAASDPVGFLAGIAIATRTIPGVAVGGILALLAGVGAGWGAFLGSYVGVGDRATVEHEAVSGSH